MAHVYGFDRSKVNSLSFDEVAMYMSQIGNIYGYLQGGKKLSIAARLTEDEKMFTDTEIAEFMRSKNYYLPEGV